jgi:hypothetical protein
LGDVQLVGGAREMAMARDRLEVAEVADVHGSEDYLDSR